MLYLGLFVARQPFFKLLRVTSTSVMDRYIATELAMPFLFGVGAFSAVGLAIGAVFDLVQKVADSGLALTTALQVLLLQIPEFVVLAFPMSTLLTTLVVYSRLSGDSEIIALRGCGVSIYRLVLPAIVLSVFVTGITFLFNESLVPSTNQKAAVVLDQALDQQKPTFQENNIFYREFSGGQLSQVFYARRFDGRQLQNLMVLNFVSQELKQIVTAKSAIWNPGQERWAFLSGTIYSVASNGSYEGIVNFAHQSFPYSRVPLDLAKHNRQPEQMSIVQAQQYLQLLEQTGDQRQIRKLKLRIQEKYALPFICVVFGLAGASLGTRPQRTSTITGFGISVVIIFSYYLLSFVSSSLGDAGVFTPFVAAWLPAVLGLITGSVLLFRAAQ